MAALDVVTQSRSVVVCSAQPGVQPVDRLKRAQFIAKMSLTIMQEFAEELGHPRLVLIGRRFLVITLTMADLDDETAQQLRRYRLIRALEQRLQLPVMAEHRMARIEFAFDLGVPPADRLVVRLANLVRRLAAYK